jgi:RNA polymerase sigma-70 factor (ECF subfamily)
LAKTTKGVSCSEPHGYGSATDTHAQGGLTATIPVLVQCLSRIAAGDRRAFERLYRLTSPRLFAVIRRMIWQRQPAEDVLQEAFLTIWRKAAQFDPTTGNAMAWMTTIARHRAIDWLRRAGGEAQGPAPEIEAGAGTTAEQSVLISECLDTLPPPQRQAILLAYYHGMSHAEISRSLGVPIGTVKSRVRRGLAAIKDMIAR